MFPAFVVILLGMAAFGEHAPCVFAGGVIVYLIGCAIEAQISTRRRERRRA